MFSLRVSRQNACFYHEQEFILSFSLKGKNTLVILLQLYRLYVVQSENKKTKVHKRKLKHHQQQQQRQKQNSKGGKGHRRHDSSDDIYIISNEKSNKQHKKRFEDLTFHHISLMIVNKIFSHIFFISNGKKC